MCYDFKFVQLHHAHQGMVPRHFCLTGNLGVVSARDCASRPENVGSEHARSYQQCAVWLRHISKES